MNLFGETEYRCLLADPPWAEKGGGKIKRGADRHYEVADVETIRDAIRGSGEWLPAKHAHFWCWYTDNFLPDALWLVGELGFAYKRTFIWAKTRASIAEEDEPTDDDLRMGIGQYGRGCHEGLIFAVRGQGQDPSAWTGNRSVRTVFHAPHVLDAQGKRIHSAKPPESYALIERVSRGPRIELFARRARANWNVWGNEAP